jgi:integrase
LPRAPLTKLVPYSVSPLLKLCFEFLVLTAGRSIEVRGALKSEIDVTKQLWRIDGSRMKTNITHTVPLSDRAMQIVQQAIALSPDSKFIFPSGRIQKPFSDQAFTKVILKENLQAPYTAHGFRSSFRMWAGKMTSYERVVCELCLAHDIKTEVEAAYDRNDYEDKRRHLMQDWANYLRFTQHDKVNAK